MSDLLKTTGKKNNVKKGIAAEAKARRRLEAEERNQKYKNLSLKEKLERNSARVRNRLESVK